MVSSENILTGHIWTDHSRSDLRLKTYTGTASASLQAALPIFAAFVAAQTWSIVRLLIWHISYRRQGKRFLCWRRLPIFKGCAEQQAIIIRNSSGGLLLFNGLVRHWWHWRRWFLRRRAPYHVCFPFVTLLICVLHFSGWIVAGVMVGQIWSSSSQDQALLRGTCGDIAFSDPTNTTQDFAYRALNNNYTTAADEYVRQCYVDDVLPTSSCSYLPQRRINFTEGVAACPFLGDGTCLQSTSPYTLDSQYIDSSDDLGINAPIQDRFYFRKQTTCSPISSAGRAVVVSYNQATDTQEWPSDTRLYRFYYGTLVGNDSSNSYLSNWTYEFSSWKPEHNLQYDVR